MSHNLWNAEIIKQLKQESGQALLSDEQTLVLFSQDFGGLVKSKPNAVSIPKDVASIQSLINFSSQKRLPLTIRGNGLSQCGQSLPVNGGLTLSMQNFNKPLELIHDRIWVEANTSFSCLLEQTLAINKAPFVVPYNCNLAVGGVLSMGGVGASSFKYGTLSAHVAALEVIDGQGIIHRVDCDSSLFHACLSGQGRFAVITKACIELKPVKSLVKTFALVYLDQKQWFEDIETLKAHADYLEIFCSPSIQGMKLKKGKREPLAQWLYGIQLSIEYQDKAPENVLNYVTPWKLINTQDEPIPSYFLRHNSRFENMKMLGQWELLHPWYECFVPMEALKSCFDELLNELPLHYANFIHVVPIMKKPVGFLMLPESESICSFMILNPGIPEVLKDSCLKAIATLDKRFLQLGGKRYLSGFIGHELTNQYWKKHFGDQYQLWIDLKKQFDPDDVFTSTFLES